MPTSFYIFLIASFIALIPACFDHGETWQEIKSGEESKKRQNLIKLFALWAIPVLTIIGTIYLGIESVISDRQQQQSSTDLTSAHKEIFGLSNQVQQETHQINTLSNDLAAAHIKPLKERLIDCLNSIDIRVLPALKAGKAVALTGPVEEYKYTQLQLLANEQGANQYIIFRPDKWVGMILASGIPGAAKRLDVDVLPELVAP